MSIYFDFKTINELTNNNYNCYRKEKEFTIEELRQYNGENGNPAYVAIEGWVYDVSKIPAWERGKDFGFTAGEDLSEQFVGFHGIIDVLDNAPKVGVLVDNEYMNNETNMAMNRLTRQQDTSKFTPDDWIRYTVPLVVYALREPTQGMNLQRIYQKIVLMGVLVGSGKTPQQAINQVQDWQSSGTAKLLQGGTTTGTGGITGTTGGVGTGGTTGGTTGTTGGVGTGGTTGGTTGTTGGVGTGGTTGGTTGTGGGFGTGGIISGTTGGTGGGFGTGATTGGAAELGGTTGTSGGFGTGSTGSGTGTSRNTGAGSGIGRDRLNID